MFRFMLLNYLANKAHFFCMDKWRKKNLKKTEANSIYYSTLLIEDELNA